MAAKFCDMEDIRDLVGQRFVVDFPGTEITPGLRRLIRKGRVGGVILFSGNIASVAQVQALTRDLQALASEAGLPSLWISVDQEGGIVNRFGRDFPVFPSAMAIGAEGDEEAASIAGSVTGRALRALGINVNHAPVLDVNVNPDNPIVGIRAFGDDPEVVGRLGSAYVRALQAWGVLCTVKHFPGHGDVAVDSHLELPVVDKPLEVLEREELAPFRAAFTAGARGLMAAHVLYPALDAGLPATLSARVLTGLLRGRMGFDGRPRQAGPDRPRHTGLLRGRMGFDGVVFTDAMGMKAVADRWTRGEAAVAALRAGADVVMACGTEAEQWASIRSALSAAAAGVLDAGQIAASTRRILRAKEACAGPPGRWDIRAEDFAAAQSVADRAVTLLRDRVGRVPLRPGRTAVMHLGGELWDRSPTALGHELLQVRPNVEVVTDPHHLASDVWTNVVVASLSWRSVSNAEVVRDLWARVGERLVVVGVGNPYELAGFPEVGTYLATYGPDAPSLRAAARVLTGELLPRGRLPVAIPGLYPRGHRGATDP
ncbi:MAG: glycoside hydrolase family 3 N-terminal domain-containing protein [Armatimonadota bacterium]|nr:glycoside hydrolase family 3 N-terminal domain-containing protein [Armatimonadota bacterium]MDR5697856.1 glycoside hydrolase family 3 N-terminal domain-containing protein [Armatimonadota bacterium]